MFKNDPIVLGADGRNCAVLFHIALLNYPLDASLKELPSQRRPDLICRLKQLFLSTIAKIRSYLQGIPARAIGMFALVFL